MVTIHNLEVRLDVEGEGDEAVFCRYFDKYIRKWAKLQDEARKQQRRSEENRSLGDRQQHEGGQ